MRHNSLTSELGPGPVYLIRSVGKLFLYFIAINTIADAITVIFVAFSVFIGSCLTEADLEFMLIISTRDRLALAIALADLLMIGRAIFREAILKLLCGLFCLATFEDSLH